MLPAEAEGNATDLADAGVADEEELEEVVVLAGVHGGRVWLEGVRARSVV